MQLFEPLPIGLSEVPKSLDKNCRFASLELVIPTASHCRKSFGNDSHCCNPSNFHCGFRVPISLKFRDISSKSLPILLR